MRLIDANKLINYFYYGDNDRAIIDEIADRKIIDIIREQPTVEIVNEVPKDGGWIPCSDRLPEKNVHVLVTMEDGNMYVAEHISKVMIGTLECRWRTFSAYFASDDIIAWMPLPEPYQKEGE